MLAMNLDKSMFEELIKNRVVTDIVVVALLRVQGNEINELNRSETHNPVNTTHYSCQHTHISNILTSFQHTLSSQHKHTLTHTFTFTVKA